MCHGASRCAPAISFNGMSLAALNGQSVQFGIALTLIYASPTTINKVTTTFDENDNFEVAYPISVYHVQNVMTHELGHWYMLDDIDSPSSCKEITMWHKIAAGEIKKTRLEPADIEGANWQYP